MNPNPATISANAPTEASSSFVLLIFPPPLAAITSCHRAIDLRQGKTPAISKLMKIKKNGDWSRSRPRESREFREFPRIPRIEGLGEGPLAEFELLFVDFQGF